MTYILLALFFILCLIALYLDHLRRRDLAIARRAAHLVEDYHRQVVEDKQIADKDEALIKRLYSRINELEARCYRLRRQIGNKVKPLYVVKGHYVVTLSVAEGDNKVTQLYELGRNGEIDFVEWLN